MKITILTLFPEMFDGPFRESILKRAQEKGLLEINLVDIRDFGQGKHQVVDDHPYGGGVGMVMRVDILDRAIQSVKDPSLSQDQQKIILLDARGETFKQENAKELSSLTHIILICGHYEGVDERVRSYIDETISIGDFILTGGEIPAMLMTDAIARLVPGVLKEDATAIESFSEHLLEFPQYTFPQEYKGESVPDILVSGNHKKIEEWREEQAEILTKKHRPDLLEK